MVTLDRNRQFKPDVSNEMILNAIRKNASYDYQKRIPAATKANVRDTLQSLSENRPYWNEFVDALINRIGLEIYRTLSWNNPLAQFKIGQLEFGDTIEEVIVGLLEAKVYDPNREYLEKDLFGTERPEVQSSFHKVNRRNFYKITVNEALLRQAFVAPNGLASFVQQIMSAPLTSDNYDEFLLTTSLFAEYERQGGFFNVNVPDLANVSSDSSDAKEALRRMREMGGTLPFLSRHYNAAGMPAFANQEDLVLFLTPGANAALDVEALAGAFNISKADLPGRTVIIPDEHFNMPGTQAIMTTRDFFVIADQLYRTESQWNPAALHNNYFLHHWQVISFSRFVPAVRFSTDDSTVIAGDMPTPVTVDSVEAVDHTFTDVEEEMERGKSYGIDAVLTWVDSAVVPDNYNAVHVSISGHESDRTYVTQTGTLYVAADESADSIDVTVTAYLADADGDPVTDTVTMAVVGDYVRLWPNPEVITPDDGGEGEGGTP